MGMYVTSRSAVVSQLFTGIAAGRAGRGHWSADFRTSLLLSSMSNRLGITRR